MGYSVAHDFRRGTHSSDDLQDLADGLAALVSGFSSDAPPAKAAITTLTTFQTGHGYTAAGGASSNLNDTSDYLLGSQAASIVSAGNGAGVTLKKTGQTAVNMTGKCWVVWFKCDDQTHLATAQLYAGDTSFTNFWTFNLGDTVSTRSFQSNEWFWCVVPWIPATTTGSPTRSAITDLQLRFTDDSAGAATMRWGGIGTVAEPSQFPNGVVSIDFDDGFVAAFTEGRKKLDQYGFPASSYVITDLVGTDPAYLTLAQLTELQEKHGWDVCSHALRSATHNATGRFASLSAGDLEVELTGVRKWMADNGFKGGDHLAYPGGTLADWSVSVETAVRKYFRTARTTSPVPKQAWPPDNQYRLRIFNVSNGVSTATVQTEIDNAFTNKYWLRLLFHNLVVSPAQGIEYSIANFGTIVDYLNTKGIPVRTARQVLSTR